jgi:hypothetical protein
MRLGVLSTVATISALPAFAAQSGDARSNAVLMARLKWPTPAQVRAVFPDIMDVEGRWQLPLEDFERLGYRGANPRQRGVDLVESKAGRWRVRNQKLTIVVLGLDVHSNCDAGPRGFIVGVLDGKGKLLARSEEVTSFGSQLGGSAEHSVTIDTAPYRINDDEQAFGVRLQHGRADLNTCFDDEVLHLFRIVGDKVVRILTTDAAYEQIDADGGESHPSCFRDAFKGTFRMLPTKTLGFFDIERKMTNGVRTVVYQWNGTGYALVGPDPIDHIIRARWDDCTGLPSCSDDCETRPGYPWERAAKAADPKATESPKNPDVR